MLLLSGGIGLVFHCSTKGELILSSKVSKVLPNSF